MGEAKKPDLKALLAIIKPEDLKKQFQKQKEALQAACTELYAQCKAIEGSPQEEYKIGQPDGSVKSFDKKGWHDNREEELDKALAMWKWADACEKNVDPEFASMRTQVK